MADSERRRRRSRQQQVIREFPAGRDDEGSDTPRPGPVRRHPADGRARHPGLEGARHPADEGGPVAGRSAQTPEVYDPTPAQPGSRRRPEPGPPAEERDGERGLRGLLGSGSSQLSIGAALRARDAARPSEADLVEAEQRLVVVRRNWVPREELPGTDRR